MAIGGDGRGKWKHKGTAKKRKEAQVSYPPSRKGMNA